MDDIYVYRGVHAKHVKLADAKSGIVVPGDPGGDMTPEEHNVLNESAASQFTSWTYSLRIASRFADSRGTGGVVLRVLKTQPLETDAWSWHASPDHHNEKEVLLQGIRIDLEVLDDDPHGSTGSVGA